MIVRRVLIYICLCFGRKKEECVGGDNSKSFDSEQKLVAQKLTSVTLHS